MTLRGRFEGHALEVVLQRFDERTLQLNKRGFHWISEYPFNQ